MRVMVDTNVIISAILNEGSLPDMVLNEVCENHGLIRQGARAKEFELAMRRLPDCGLILHLSTTNCELPTNMKQESRNGCRIYTLANHVMPMLLILQRYYISVTMHCHLLTAVYPGAIICIVGWYYVVIYTQSMVNKGRIG